MAKKNDEKKMQMPKFDEEQAKILDAVVVKLKDLPDAEPATALKDTLFEERITANFDVIYDALTIKGVTKNEFIEMLKKEGVNASLFKFNKVFNALVEKHGKTPVNKWKKEAIAGDKK